ncbi:TPA: ead/Ea22-like family protein [Klebsiella michiganensis]|nr:ead/Ea22-like family protein [Klebsiella michiganensis]
MTTDITELAQSLKAAAIDAKELAIIARYSKGRAAAEKFYALANPANVISLVEALEKAQQRIDELENDEVRQRLANAEHQLYMAELAKHNLKASRKAQFRKRKAAEKRIAELESRTVKLPHLPDDCDRADANFYYMKALADAGIKWEAE